MRQMFADAVVEHAIPGRVRLRFRARKGDTDFFREVVKALSAHPAVDEIEANPCTGGVLVRHSLSEQEFAALAGTMGIWAGADEQEAQPRHQPGKEPEISLDLAGLFGLAMMQLTRGRTLGSATEHLYHAVQAKWLNLPGLTLPLLSVALVQIMRGRMLSPASSLLMYALMISARRSRER
jgi:hypothetical protein